MKDAANSAAKIRPVCSAVLFDPIQQIFCLSGLLSGRTNAPRSIRYALIWGKEACDFAEKSHFQPAKGPRAALRQVESCFPGGWCRPGLDWRGNSRAARTGEFTSHIA